MVPNESSEVGDGSDDVVIADGTHNVDQYGLIAMFNTLVDALGKSVIHSYTRFRSDFTT